MIYIYVLVASIIGFCQMGIDKKKARAKDWRIPEKSLWLVAILGGAIGSYIGMKYFRHKTKHIQFQIGFPLLAVIDVTLLFLSVFSLR